MLSRWPPGRRRDATRSGDPLRLSWPRRAPAAGSSNQGARCACRRPTATRRAARRDGRQRQSTSCRRGRGARGRSARAAARARMRGPPGRRHQRRHRRRIAPRNFTSVFIDSVCIYQCRGAPPPRRSAPRLRAALEPQAAANARTRSLRARLRAALRPQALPMCTGMNHHSPARPPAPDLLPPTS